jgi:alpha-mannosidase
MAEELLLRNDLFEVRLSDVTGGIAHVLTYRRSPSRISQQVAWRFSQPKRLVVGEGDEQETVETWYTAMQLRESRILSEGPVIGEIETIGDVVDPLSNEVLATYRQRTRVVRGRSAIEVELELAPSQLPQGDPWTNYLGCRFAWKHSEVALTASMQQGAQSVTAQRIEAPQYLEIADDDFRTTILTPGLPFHRKTGERMLDTLLLVEGETTRRFHFSIAVDSRYPMQASLDQYSPPVVVPTSTTPAEPRQGWFFNVTAANVQLVRLLAPSDVNKVVVRLLETEGRARVFGLECYRSPQQARQINFRGETISDLRIDDAVNVEIAPYEICDVELTF